MRLKISVLMLGAVLAMRGDCGRRPRRQMGPRRGCAYARSARAERGPDDRVQRSDLRAADRARQRQQARARHSRRPGSWSIRPPGNSSCARTSNSTTAMRSPPTTSCSRSSARCSRRRTTKATSPTQGDREGRRPDGAPEDQRPEPAGAGQSHRRLHHEQGVGGGEQRAPSRRTSRTRKRTTRCATPMAPDRSCWCRVSRTSRRS